MKLKKKRYGPSGTVFLKLYALSEGRNVLRIQWEEWN